MQKVSSTPRETEKSVELGYKVNSGFTINLPEKKRFPSNKLIISIWYQNDHFMNMEFSY